MSIFSFLKNPSSKHPEVDVVLRSVLDRFFLIFLILGALALGGSLLRVCQYGWRFQQIIHLFIYCILAVTFLMRKRLTVRAVSLLLLSIVGLNAIANLYAYGIASMGIVMFACIITMVAMFLGMREGLITMGLSIIVLVGLAVAICSGYISMHFDANTYITSWTAWITHISSYALFLLPVIVLVDRIKTRLLSSLHDLEKRSSELSNANLQLTESERNIRAIIETAPEAITTTDLNGVITSCNRATLDLHGYSDECDLIGKEAFQLIAPEDRQRAAENLNRMLRENIMRDIEYNVLNKRGQRIPIKLSASILRDENGDPSGYLAITQDISNTRQMEERLRQLEKMRAIGQLAGGIAHDFNNQLTGIVGFADILCKELSNSPELSYYADSILLSAKRASDLTSQLLAFARKGKYFSVTIDIHKIIGEVVGILQRTIDKRIIIKQHLDAQMAQAHGDPTQIQNAIMNIALNARDAMPNGGELIISTSISQLDDGFCSMNHYEIEHGSYVLICINDNGSGMDEETQKKIFEPFFTTKEQGKGTGMGLASVYGTVKNHSGAINVYSKPGHGTTIKMYLPQVQVEVKVKVEVEVEVEVETNSTSKNKLARHSGPTKGDAHILLVDDEKLVIDISSRMLGKCGYKVSTCRDGNEAVKYYRENWKIIDLVFLDMVMPEMNGREMFIEMKKINPQIRALLSSGYSINSEAMQILEEGVMGFIQKPYRIIELSEKVADILKKNRARKK